MTLDPELARAWPVLLVAVASAVVYPLIGLRRYRRIEHLPEPLPSRTRLRVYWNVIVSQWTLVGLAALALGAGGLSIADLGQTLGRRPAVTLAVGAALLAAFGVLSIFTTRQLRRASAEDLPLHIRRAGKILPQSDPERAWFAGVAFTAGVCEEVLYRGFLPWCIAGWTGSLLLGFVLAAAIFGLGHAYQGRHGVLVTGLLGLFFGALAWSTQSLMPGQLLHVAIDLVNGFAVGGAITRIQAPRSQAPVEPPAPLAPGDVDASAAPRA
ncbi:MAG: CPBP family intramembrane glutamic endopeptidase [Candidatus Eisenbacteria bacterium]